MSKKVTLEARIVEWAESAPIDTVQVILGIVRAKVKARTPAQAKARKVSHKAKGNAKPIHQEPVINTLGVSQ